MKMKNIKSNPIFIVGIVLLFVAIIVAGRVFPHLPNFTPVAASALFLSYLFNPKVGIIAVVAGMLISDVFFIGTHNPILMTVIYASLAMPVFLAPLLRKGLKFDNKQPKFLRVVLGALRIGGLSATGALLFYLTSNFAVWAIGYMYPHTAAGLLFCYELALPFLRTNVMGDLFYSGLFFTSYFAISWLVERYAAKKQLAVA